MYQIGISNQMISLAYEFSRLIILRKNQYNRMQPSYITNSQTLTTIRIMRTFVGKLGELVFLDFLHQQNIYPDVSEMFIIYEGQENTDTFDFITNKLETIDVKTAVFPNHIRLLVPIDQIKNLPKNYYVGVKLNGMNNDNKYENIDINSIKQATLYGYCTYESLLESKTINLGEFDCKSVKLKELKNIDDLISMM